MKKLTNQVPATLSLRSGISKNNNPYTVVVVTFEDGTELSFFDNSSRNRLTMEILKKGV